MKGYSYLRKLFMVTDQVIHVTKYLNFSKPLIYIVLDRFTILKGIGYS